MRAAGPNGAPRRLAVDRPALTARTGLRFSGDLAIEQWLHLGRQIFLIADSSAWWLGDWLVYGQDRYPNRYRTAIEETALDYQTLRNYAWVARKFCVSRRRDTLSFQHHAELAGLPEAEQERWLDRAEEMGWSTGTLRRELREHRRLSAGYARQVEAADGSVVRLEVSADRARRWELAAQSAGSALLEWACEMLDQIARDQLAHARGRAKTVPEG